MVKCLEQFKAIKAYTDRDAPGRDWNLATAMVIKGQAAMQFMGDWAKGEFTAAGKSPEKDYVARPVPDSGDTFLFNIDSFIMFKQKDKSAQKAQSAMARLIMEPKFQEVFNVNKGSIPCRSGMSRDPFDAVARRSLDDFSAAATGGSLLPSMAQMGLIPALTGVALVMLTFEFGIVSLLPLATELAPEAGRRAET